MGIFRFVFSFLYTRNWYSGEYELSRPRMILFVAMLFLIGIALLVIAYLQTPVTYSAQ